MLNTVFVKTKSILKTIHKRVGKYLQERMKKLQSLKTLMKFYRCVIYFDSTKRLLEKKI